MLKSLNKRRKPIYTGYYINLARDVSKRKTIERYLAHEKICQYYSHFNAIDGAKVAHEYMPTNLSCGEIGCWLSHLNVMDKSVNFKRHIHIVEDDTLVSRYVPKLFESFCAHHQGWDIVFTDFFILPNVHVYKVFNEKMEEFKESGSVTFMNISKLPFCCTSSYFVNRNSIEKILKLISTCAQNSLPIDLMFRKLANEGILNVYSFMPFFSFQPDNSGEMSSIREINMVDKLYSLFRQSFYFDADLKKIYNKIDEIAPCHDISSATIYGKVMEILSGKTIELR